GMRRVVPRFIKITWTWSLLVGCLAGMGLVAADPLSEADLHATIRNAVARGGDEIALPPGIIRIEKGLRLKDVKNLTLTGSPGDTTILQLPPLVYAISESATLVGADRIAVTKLQGFGPGMRLHLETDGEVDPFTKKPRPYVIARVKTVEEGVLVLTEGLKFPVPTGTLIRDPDAPNLIEIREGCEGIRIENLVLDGGRIAGDPPLRAHVQLCGVLMQGRYSYEKGPTEARPSGLVLVNCLVRNCHGRGVALYSAQDCEIRGNRFFDISDEAIDLDHFTVRVQVVDNEVRHAFIGVEMNDASGCLIEGNRIFNCRTGLHLWQFCKLPGLNEGNRIVRNRFEGFRGKAIQIQEHLTRNTVAENFVVGE
ncbi:MAG: right-handed parallel beta-helix repeat-containing protein, partial [Verrucomicrobiales bacterium]